MLLCESFRWHNGAVDWGMADLQPPRSAGGRCSLRERARGVHRYPALCHGQSHGPDPATRSCGLHGQGKQRLTFSRPSVKPKTCLSHPSPRSPQILSRGLLSHSLSAPGVLGAGPPQACRRLDPGKLLDHVCLPVPTCSDHDSTSLTGSPEASMALRFGGMGPRRAGRAEGGPVLGQLC